MAAEPLWVLKLLRGSIVRCQGAEILDDHLTARESRSNLERPAHRLHEAAQR